MSQKKWVLSLFAGGFLLPVEFEMLQIRAHTFAGWVVGMSAAALSLGTGMWLALRRPKARLQSLPQMSPNALYFEGRIDEAIAMSENLLHTTPRALNERIYIAVASGQYRKVIARVECELPKVADVNAHLDEQFQLKLQRINFCEALICVGDDVRADVLLASLSATTEIETQAQALIMAGMSLTRAWMAWTSHDAIEASRWALQLGPAALASLQHGWLDETYFARAMALALSGHCAEAMCVAQSAPAMRASSERNQLVICGRIAKLAGDIATAAAFFQEAADNAYQHQNGDGLFLLGECREQLGDIAAAADAYRLCLARDPESRFAVAATAALQCLAS